MTLHIVTKPDIDFCTLDTISIAGKDILEYWLEWARHKEYEKLYIHTDKSILSSKKIKSYSELYGVTLEIHEEYIKKNILGSGVVYRGIGVFLDDGTYNCFHTLDDILAFEQIIISDPLKYSPLLGYGKSSTIQIGKNVYIHSSVELQGKVIIGNNCSIEKNVYIKNSVINSGCVIKSDSIIKESHISKNLQIATKLYLNNKVLFESDIYDITAQNMLPHEGICLKTKAS